MKVNEIFESIQGEGQYAGYSALFIRLSGCTRSCDFCDTKYHTEGATVEYKEIIDIIEKSKVGIVVWTGGEPMLQIDDILKIIKQTKNKKHHVETNADIITEDLMEFDYICASPKNIKSALAFYGVRLQFFEKYDIKIVTDGKQLNKDLIPYATILMPLSTQDEKENIEIMQRVWKLCIKENKKFCLRQHVVVWGLNERGI